MNPMQSAKLRSRLIRNMRTGATKVQEEFTKPDDDWQMVTAGTNKKGETIVLAIDGSFFESEEGKDLLAEEVLPDVIRTQGFVAFALVVSTWMVAWDRSTEEGKTEARREVEAYQRGELTLSEHPNRMEALLVMGADRFGDESYMAKIVRYEDRPPTLEPWERFAGDAADTMTGRFVDPFRRALRPQG